jgi:hypothetical protein
VPITPELRAIECENIGGLLWVITYDGLRDTAMPACSRNALRGHLNN